MNRKEVLEIRQYGGYDSSDAEDLASKCIELYDRLDNAYSKFDRLYSIIEVQVQEAYRWSELVDEKSSEWEYRQYEGYRLCVDEIIESMKQSGFPVPE